MDASYCYACDLSQDGKVFARLWATVEISDPIGSPFPSYKPDPFSSSASDISSTPSISFSPDGKQLLLLLQVASNSDEAWLLPYPPGTGSPHRLSISGKLPNSNIPNFAWMPDGRNLVMSLAPDESLIHRLWMTSTSSNELTPLTTGTNEEDNPRVSPDGKSILYSQVTMRYDLTSVSLDDGATKTLITSGHLEFDPASSANQAKLVWVTNRSGKFEIWTRLPDGSDKPAVTNAEFPRAGFLCNPALSPDGERIAYVGPGSGTGGAGSRIWISLVNGGPPVQLTNTADPREYGGSWSPDGSQFVYLRTDSDATRLTLVKTSGNATPSVLKEHVRGEYLPDWSPSGKWITYRDKNGWWLTSPDGKTSKSLGKIETPYLAFSKDSKLLYGIQTGETEGNPQRATIFSLDPVTLKQKAIRELGKELAPASPDTRIRFGMALDGKSFVYPTLYYREDLWILSGYRQPGWRARISEVLGLK